METSLYVPPYKRKMFEMLFEGYAKGLGMTGSVEFVRLESREWPLMYGSDSAEQVLGRE